MNVEKSLCVRFDGLIGCGEDGQHAHQADEPCGKNEAKTQEQTMPNSCGGAHVCVCSPKNRSIFSQTPSPFVGSLSQSALSRSHTAVPLIASIQSLFFNECTQ